MRWNGWWVWFGLVWIGLCGVAYCVEGDEEEKEREGWGIPSSNLWGTFRPRQYAAIRARVPHSPSFVWSWVEEEVDHDGRRFWRLHSGCDGSRGGVEGGGTREKETDGFRSGGEGEEVWFGFDRHDGRNYARHRVEHRRGTDRAGWRLITEWVQVNGRDWGWRLTGEPLGGDPPSGWRWPAWLGGSTSWSPQRKVSMLFSATVGMESILGPHFAASLVVVDRTENHVELRGNDDRVGGSFSVHVHAKPAPHQSGILDHTPSCSVVGLVSEYLDVMEHWKVAGDWIQDRMRMTGNIGDGHQSEANIHVAQFICSVPFALEVRLVHHGGRSEADVEQVARQLTDRALLQRFEDAKEHFEQKFRETFQLDDEPLVGVMSEDRLEFAKQTLSNLLGGIGYFFGSTQVDLDMAKNHLDPDEEKHGVIVVKERRLWLRPRGLLTSTPSRSLFPRGFFWDEGFHQLLILRWDKRLAQECILSWFSTQTSTGWFPREQVLGFDAIAAFPRHVEHLLVQDPTVANPPTLLAPLRVLAHQRMLRNTIRNGTENNDPDTSESDNAEFEQMFWLETMKSMTKLLRWLEETQRGEEDGSFRWRGRSKKQITPDGYPHTLASGLDDYPRALEPHENERHVDLHSWIAWSHRVFADITETMQLDEYRNHSRSSTSLLSLLYRHHRTESGQFCDYDGEDFVCHEGYVTILPIILGLLDSSSSTFQADVEVFLEMISDPDRLSSPCGIRSLSKADEYHHKGDFYWTGPCWQPFNFLTLAALKEIYSTLEGSTGQKARLLYQNLRQNVVDGVFLSWSDSATIHEQYSDDDGAGRRGKSFTGWSALVVLMMAELYDGLL